MGSSTFVSRWSLKPPWQFCGLLKWYQRYLPEGNDLKELAMTCAINRQAPFMADCDKELLTVDVLISVHQAQAAESLGEPLKAIELNEQAYKMRFDESPQQMRALCCTANNVAQSNTSAKLYQKAQDWFEISDKWWHLAVKNGEESGDRPARHILDHAQNFMRLHEYAKAEEMLDICISRIKTEYPLDWAMLAQ
ncbi:hypothetical protein N7517_000794 [Penicillium concentricum]|uniref:Uncharacterized protein n=1 Tax=Penicillium concentricum TaxID=293559 RepID=A0A9W9VHX2_9EURO|nr:uncharacterized protein N7517_000794 [Penicillium concentricum]KAJ5382883.1 hypothetical protein N7517_000794 [Penicillium concentricum]